MKTYMKKAVKEYTLMTVGVILLTVGVYVFKIPNGFSTGGVSGIGTLLGKLGILPASTWISIINIALLVVGFAFLGKDTGVRTVYCSLLFSGLVESLGRIFPMSAPLTDEPLLELVYAMMLTALGSALMFKYGGSSGGTDIVALILKKYTSAEVGKCLLMVDAAVAVSSIFVFGIKIGLFSIAGLFAKAFLVDNIIESMNVCKYFVIITSEPEKIIEYVSSSLHHSATVVEARGAYTGDGRTMIHTVCRRIEAIRLQKRVREIDPHSFMIVTSSSEIIGRGFRNI